MRMYELTKGVANPKKRLGRGLGSGRGKTSGRGTKGQGARGKVKTGFTGGGLPFYKKLPLRRGLRNPRIFKKPMGINLQRLEVFKQKDTIDIQALADGGIISKKDLKIGIKILGSGEIKKALNIKIPISKKAKEKIEKAGGKILNV